MHQRCAAGCITLAGFHPARSFPAMKCCLLLSVCITSCSLLHGQVTIGPGDMPHSGDEFQRTRATLNLLANFGATGADHTWDFSGLTAAGEQGTEYVNVASTNPVYALVYADVPFNPNRADHASAGTEIPFSEFLPIDDPYTFRRGTANSYSIVGYGMGLEGIPVPVIFGERDVVYELPLNFGNTSTSQSSWSVSLPTLAYYGYQQTRQNEVDGWGTVITPSGTYEVLRVKSTITGSDSVNFDAPGFGFRIPRPIVREYKWLAPGVLGPVLQINTVDVLGLEVITTIDYFDQPHTISVLPPLADLLCAGSTTEVHYGRTGSYNSGSFLVPANKFKVQLSDSTGDFSNPVNLGAITTTEAGVISATIPAGTMPASGYRIRVVSTSPAFTGADNGYDLTIAGAPTAQAAANGSTTFCSGGSVELLANAAPGAGYQWYRDGSPLEGADAATWAATDAGTYTVEVANLCGTAMSGPIAVNVAPLPVHELAEAELFPCNGVPVVLEAVNTSGDADLAYQWLLNGIPVAGGNSAVLATAEAGAYNLLATDTLTGCTFTSSTAFVVPSIPPVPVLSASGPTTFCEGGAVMLVADASADEFLWLMDGMPLEGEAGDFLEVMAGGNYGVAAIGEQGCTGTLSNVVAVEVFPAPEPPVITASGPLSFCEGGQVVLVAGTVEGAATLWSNGAGTDTITVDAEGGYTAIAVDGNGCSSVASAAVEVTVHELPVAPVITEEAGSLFASGSGVIQWALNGVPLEGATGPVLVPVVSGVYTATVTDANGCTSTSSEYVLLATGLHPTGPMELLVSPNPSDGRFMITVEGGANRGKYRVIDPTGREVEEQILNGARTEMDLRGRAPGTYLLQWEIEGQAVRTVRVVLF